MTTIGRSVMIFVCVVFLTVLAMAQGSVPGVPHFGTFGGGPFDTINIGNLNVHFEIPIINKPGKGGMNAKYSLAYDSSVWSPTYSNGYQAWQPVNNFGWSAPAANLGGVLTYDSYDDYCQGRNGFQAWIHYYSNYVYMDAKRVTHYFFGSASYDECTHTQVDDTVHLDGYSLSISGNGGYYTLLGPSGEQIWPSSADPLSGTASISDANGNSISMINGTMTDSLGKTALVITGSAAPSPFSYQYTYQYTGPSGPVLVAVKYKPYTVQTNFGNTAIYEYNATGVNLVSEVDLPDGTSYKFDYEPTPTTPPMNCSGCVTGRLKSITLPTGGTIQYSYTGGYNGIDADGTTSACNRTTPDGAWSYVRSGSQTTVTDPTGAQTVYNFANKLYETEHQAYIGNPSSTKLSDVETCYNGNTSNCATATTVSTPITARSVTTCMDPSSANQCKKRSETYNTNSLLTQTDEYDWGKNAPGSELRRTSISYNAGLVNIVDHPSEIDVYEGASLSTKAITKYGYDQYGNTTSVASWVSGTTYLTSSAIYGTGGVLQSTTDVNNAQTTYSYDGPSCNGAFPTGVTQSSGTTQLQTSKAWNCDGGVVTSFTDLNSKTTTYAYNDPFWRVKSTTDPLGNVTTYTYTSNTFESALPFNGTQSTQDVLITLDSLGRSHITQRRQSPSATTFDSVETDYDTLGRPYRATTPYSASAGGTNPNGQWMTTSYDALGRTKQVTDASGGWVSYSYAGNDVYQSVGPAATGAPLNDKQLEYDGVGRLTSVCEITSASGSGTCAQTKPKTGYWTQYAYTACGSNCPTGAVYQQTVTQNAQSATKQTRTYSYDGMGRLLAETNPESNTTSYTYDTDSTCGTSKGDLVKRVDAVANTTCYTYDKLHRVTQITYPSGAYSSSTPTKNFIYDYATVNGVQMQNVKGQLAEAYTCTTSCYVTDLGYSYYYDTNKKQLQADVYQKTPNSGGYYKITEFFWPTGGVAQLTGLPGMPTLTYGADGEGRPSAVSASMGQNPVTSTSYNLFGQAQHVTLGSFDADAFNFDANTGRMTQYQFTVGTKPKSVVGQLNWNPNGSLAQLKITDPFNSANQRTCNYIHDDLGRIASVDCGTGNWKQLFSYDAFGNISKNVPLGYTGTSFLPTYSAASNQFSQGTFDSNGNLKLFENTYTWDAENNLLTVNTNSATYDALWRTVEIQSGGSTTQVVYAPDGQKLALMNGLRLRNGFVSLPGGAVAVYNSSGLAYYRHPDWLGSSRLASTPARSVYSETAYAPFGEPYAQSGTIDLSFTGQTQDTNSGVYDFLYRRYSPVQGRWLSPDPAGLAAVDPKNPQSWNRYSYVLNSPLTFVDHSGMWHCVFGYNQSTGVFEEDLKPEEGGRTKEECRRDGGTWQNDLGDLPAIDDENSMEFELMMEFAGSGQQSYDSWDNLWDFCGSVCGSILSGASNFSAGAGDFLSFGLTTQFNTWTGAQSAVGTNSGAYAAGVITGVGVTAAGGALGAGKAFAGLETKIAIHGAHHPFWFIGKVPHLQIMWWLAGAAGSDQAIRIALTPWWP